MRWIPLAMLATLTFHPAVAQQQSQASRAKVRLEAKDGKTHFLLGDIISLELVFTDPAFPDQRSSLPRDKAWLPLSGQAVVNNTDYNDLADEVSITPSDGWFQWQGHSGHDYLTQTPLDSTGVRLPLILNQGYVFREPGHYEITVKTLRLRGEPLTTNALGIDIDARSAEDECALVKTLDATIASAQDDDQKHAAEQLAYLPGDDAARAKVKWLLKDDQEVAFIVTKGLAATKNQQLQLQLIKDAWANPKYTPQGTLQQALIQAEAFAHHQMQPGWTMVRPIPKDDSITRQIADEYRDDLDRVIATLPQRTGDNLRDTAYYLMEDNQLTPEQLARVKPAVLLEFSHMDPLAQSMLIETRWNVVNDQALIPSLKAIIDGIDSKEQYADPATAVERLIEIDEHESRPYVVKMICRTQRGLLLDKLNAVKEDRLPETDDCLAAFLAKGERRENDFDWEQAAQRAARFATPAILPRIKPAWTNRTQDPSMLALLIRDSPKEAVDLLNREPDIQWYPTNKVYEALGSKYPPEVLAWLRTKAPVKLMYYELANFGEPQDRLLLNKRLDDLRKQWRGREPELDAAQVNTPEYTAKSEEQELVSSLLHAKAWTLTTEEKARITDACLTDWCRRYAPPSPASNLEKSGPLNINPVESRF